MDQQGAEESPQETTTTVSHTEGIEAHEVKLYRPGSHGVESGAVGPAAAEADDHPEASVSPDFKIRPNDMRVSEEVVLLMKKAKWPDHHGTDLLYNTLLTTPRVIVPTPAIEELLKHEGYYYRNPNRLAKRLQEPVVKQEPSEPE